MASPDPWNDDATRSIHEMERHDQLCSAYEEALNEGREPPLEQVLARVPEGERPALFVHLVRVALECLAPPPTLAELAARFPQYAHLLADFGRGDDAARESGRGPGQPAPADPRAEEPPASVGGYHILAKLGRGTFGVVYRGHDDRLNRSVAVKVPHPHLVSSPADAAAYLAEARTVAGLDHPNIVKVFHCGATEEHPFFVVSQYIDGGDLAARLRAAPLTLGEAGGLVATVADALHYAHTRGVVHRDVKPANLLLRQDGVPFVGDFGVALREQEVGRGPRYVGTPAYMSPEQARGEGHRVDGRSDVFALGVVLYELLTGKRPFKGRTPDEVRQVIAESEPKPPRQVRDIPRELERICLRALAKRVSERYPTAADLAADLRLFLADAPSTTATRLTPSPPPPADAPPPETPPAPPLTDSRPAAVVPKGLRSFDAADADFFLSLIPGPRDRDGLPDTLRFWKRWAETADPDAGAGVGLMYGPSGCGKTSLVRAGLLPRLARSVTAVYVEASPADTEHRLLAGLRKQVPGLPALGLVETLTALRQGRFLPAGRSVLIVLDQFEQWLHTHPADGPADLARGLRQCDGDRLRCVLMVRDDFWLAVSRFMQALEVRIEEGRNARLVDLFDPLHARRVLAAFGRAYDRLPDGPLSPEQTAFLDRAVEGLAEGGKVVSVRVALFAQMVQGKEWTPDTLAAVGGAHGVGVTFLEEAFAGPSAPLPNRVHARGAQAVLAALLPDGATGIKGHRRSAGELLAAAGYAGRPDHFADLLRLLDSDLKLITPTDTPDAPNGTPATERYYQLTHDYLVPSLREWLTRKRRETRRGRAELLLTERAGEWAVRPGRRWLPTLGEWLAIRLRTRKRGWTDPQRRMMAAGARHHGLRVGAWAAAVLLTAGLVFAGVGELLARQEADYARASLAQASEPGLPGLSDALNELDHHRPRVEAAVLDDFAANPPPKRKLALALALARWAGTDSPYLRDQLLDAPPTEFAVIRDELARHAASGLTAFLWQQASDPTAGPNRQFRAACALAAYDPQNPEWAQLAKPTVDRLLVQTPAEVAEWADMIKASTVRRRLLPPLADAIADAATAPLTAQAATVVYRQYADDDPAAYAPLGVIADLSAPTPKADESIDHLRKRANAAAALVECRQGGEPVWRFLQHSANPTLRSLLVERLAATRTNPDILMKRLQQEEDPRVRYALLLALGSYPADFDIPNEGHLLTLFEKDEDAGVHGASEWAARQRRQKEGLKGAMVKLTGKKPREDQTWFVNESGMTFSVIKAHEYFVPSEKRTRAVTVPYHFAMSAKEVTRAQWEQMKLKLPPSAGALHPEAPIGDVDFYQMAKFCNELSKAEGIPEPQWCYEPNSAREYADGMKIRDPRTHTGYRLPMAAEWELAVRARATTPFHCGDADDPLLVQYARYHQNRSVRDPIPFPVGQLKPNDFGLFDVHGNVSERAQPAFWWGWCAVLGSAAPVPERQIVGDRQPILTTYGGEATYHLSDLRFGGGITGPPTGSDRLMGFRVVTTRIP